MLQSDLPELIHKSPYTGQKNSSLARRGSTQLKLVLRKTEECEVLQMPHVGLLLML